MWSLNTSSLLISISPWQTDRTCLTVLSWFPWQTDQVYYNYWLLIWQDPPVLLAWPPTYPRHIKWSRRRRLRGKREWNFPSLIRPEMHYILHILYFADGSSVVWASQHSQYLGYSGTLSVSSFSPIGKYGSDLHN